MERNSRNCIPALIAYIVAIVVFLYFFIKRALDRGRGLELVCSSVILFIVFSLLMICHEGRLSFYITPLLIYAVYWVFMLFVVAPNVTYSTNVHWGDENWWWSLDGWEFEEEVAKVYIKNGYKAEVTKRTGDGGVDIVMYKDRKKIIVQCKHYSYPVAPEVLRALWGVKDDFRADEVILVASSGVSSHSKDFIKNKPQFKVLDLEDIMRLARD